MTAGIRHSAAPRRGAVVTAVLAAGLLATGALTGCSSGRTSRPSTSPTVTAPVRTSSSPAGRATSGSNTVTAADPAATFTEVTGTSTTVQFDAAFVRRLYTRGVSTKATGHTQLVPLSKGRDKAVLRVTGGRATVYGATRSSATTMHLLHAGGGLTVSTNQAAVRVTDLVLVVGRTSTISATITVVTDGVAGTPSSVPLFDLRPTSTLRSTAAHGVATLTGLRAYLDPVAARKLGTALGTTAFGTGSPLVYVGTVSAVVRGS